MPVFLLPSSARSVVSFAMAPGIEQESFDGFRIGFPGRAANTPAPYVQGVAYLPHLVKCAKAVMYAVIDTLTQPRAQLQL